MFLDPASDLYLTPTETKLRLRYRIIAVWAIAEAVLGGILHGLHLPVTGLVVGSIAVCCLALLSRLHPRPGNLLKATLVVLTIKAMLSPHTPLGAYVAVLSQGLLAELFFRGRSFYQLRCLGLGLVTQLQSGIQHLITVTVIFGLEFWQALDQYLNKIAENLGQGGTAFSWYFAIFYLALHAIMGLVTGWVAARLPGWLPKSAISKSPNLIPKTKISGPDPLKPSDKSKPKPLKITPGLALIWLLLFAVFLQSYFGIGPVLLPESKIARLLIRSILVASAWYFLISPVLLKVFHKWLLRQKGPLQAELAAVLHLLPETGALLKKTWQLQSHKTGIARVNAFVREAGRQLFTLPDNL